MRDIISIVEAGMRGTLPATPENIARAKAFVLRKWRERAVERGAGEPRDLTGACKFASLFAARVFGGTVEGNFFHQWVRLPDGRVLDLNDEAEDVVAMGRGEIHDSTRAYAQAMGKTLPKGGLYTHDRKHMASRDNRDSMASCEPRVAGWVNEFLTTALHEGAPSYLGETKGLGMSMHGTLDVLNRMMEEGIVETYALAGAVAAYNYIEPTVTDDLDVLVHLPASGSSGLITLGPVLGWLRAAGYGEFRHEGVVVEGWTVQFLPVASPLDEEALKAAETVAVTLTGGTVPTRVLRPEHLVAKALEIGRPKDFIRVAQFVEEGAVDMERLGGVLTRHGLLPAWRAFLRRTGVTAPDFGS